MFILRNIMLAYILVFATLPVTYAAGEVAKEATKETAKDAVKAVTKEVKDAAVDTVKATGKEATKTVIPESLKETAKKAAPATDVVEKVDINTADAKTLARILVGVGDVKAQAIVDFREKNGPFKTADDLLQVKGIGDKTLEKNRDHIIVLQEEAKGDAAGTCKFDVKKPAVADCGDESKPSTDKATDKPKTPESKPSKSSTDSPDAKPQTKDVKPVELPKK